jgi:hypothetical protein
VYCSVVSGLLDAFLDVEEEFKLTAEPGSDNPTTEQEAVDVMRKVRTPVWTPN